jgi:hypothetical protein
MIINGPLGTWKFGTPLCKKYGPYWRGRVVGYYSTENTPIGYVIESVFEPGSLQTHPADDLEFWNETQPLARSNGDDLKEDER